MYKVSNCKLIEYLRYFSSVANVDARATQEYQKNRQFHCVTGCLSGELLISSVVLLDGVKLIRKIPFGDRHLLNLIEKIIGNQWTYAMMTNKDVTIL